MYVHALSGEKRGPSKVLYDEQAPCIERGPLDKYPCSSLGILEAIRNYQEKHSLLQKDMKVQGAARSVDILEDEANLKSCLAVGTSAESKGGTPSPKVSSGV